MSRFREHPLLTFLVIAHLVALIFGLVGLLIMLPNPDLWADDPRAVRVFDWSMEYAGSTHILFGAAAMFVFGVIAIGWRKTGIFAVVSYGLSLGFELVGTGTGWPFGNYSYTDFLGWKVLGHVPYTIPFSWFYMGLAAYLMGAALVSRLGWSREGLWSVLFGAVFLTGWDLVLDPAMAHESLRIQFWEWHQTGAYFGMPLKNLAGWSVTGLVFMAVARLLWGERVRITRLPVVPFIVYVANMLFAMIISAEVGLWWPILFAIVVGILPATLLLRDSRPAPHLQTKLAAD
jgi:putative membrane protein